MTIRERISGVQKHLMDSALTPDMARESMVLLTALSGNVASEVRAAENEYRIVLLTCLEKEETANRAKLRAEVSLEYQRFKEAKDTAELVKQMIITLRAVGRSLDEEARLAR